MGIGSIAKTGLQAALSNMEVISNNIANVNSLGFKKSFINLNDMYMNAGGGQGNHAIGLGTRISSVKQDFSLGRMESSSRALDLALANGGFFVQKDVGTGQLSYTKAGRLDFNEQGYLEGIGGRIQGYPAMNGSVIGSGSLVDLKFPSTPIPAKATSTATLALNLNASEQVISSPFQITDPTTYHYRSDETIYDSLGNSYLMSLYYTKSADNTWKTQVAVNDALLSSGEMTFTDSGILSSVTGLSNIPWSPGNGATPQELDINLAGSTQYSGQSKYLQHRQDGCTAGLPVGCVIDGNGNLNVSYTNGLTQIQGQIAVAQFKVPQGLAQSANMSWIPTTESGLAILDPAASQGAFMTNSIEYSNVDLTEELVDLISAQHDFQANAQVQQTYNQLMQTIENI